MCFFTWNSSFIRFVHVRLPLINVFTDQKTQKKLWWAVAYFVNNRFHVQAKKYSFRMHKVETQSVPENSLNIYPDWFLFIFSTLLCITTSITDSDALITLCPTYDTSFSSKCPSKCFIFGWVALGWFCMRNHKRTSRHMAHQTTALEANQLLSQYGSFSARYVDLLLVNLSISRCIRCDVIAKPFTHIILM